jgi:hypothetical protein
MLWSWLAYVVLAIANWFFALFPVGGFVCPAVPGTADVCLVSGSVATQLAPYVGGASWVVPMGLVLDLLQITLSIVLPAVMVFEVAQFLYREVPQIGGNL